MIYYGVVCMCVCMCVCGHVFMFCCEQDLDVESVIKSLLIFIDCYVLYAAM